MTITERRREYDPAETCSYCGDTRDRHDRTAREWETCAAKAAYFRAEAAA